ncbi:MAG: glycine cleavage system aminomethyltransferase GcvT [Solirubrobacterales bacterium]
MTVAAETLKRTPLHECHIEAGGRLVPFAGWEMPVQYEGVRAEHLAVRGSAGLFDVSHMGEIETRGPRAMEFLRHLLTNDIGKVSPGGSQYSLLCREDGGILDDLFTYRLGDERFLTVVNASNVESDFAWIEQQAREWEGVEVVDRCADYAMLALQGPQTVAKLQPLLADGDVPERFGHRTVAVAGVRTLVCRTGYTGEDGVELLTDPQGGVAIWRELIGRGVTPAGLGARDTLRLEACYPLYGNELSVERTPIEAGLGWACALDEEFVGVERLRDQQREGTAERLIPFTFTGPGIPRAGCPVLVGDEAVGTVTSGTLSPSLDIGIGMAYVRSDLAEPGTGIKVDVRGKQRPAVTASKPLHRKDGR